MQIFYLNSGRWLYLPLAPRTAVLLKEFGFTIFSYHKTKNQDASSYLSDNLSLYSLVWLNPTVQLT